jgi:hypothetical protein
LAVAVAVEVELLVALTPKFSSTALDLLADLPTLLGTELTYK